MDEKSKIIEILNASEGETVSVELEGRKTGEKLSFESKVLEVNSKAIDHEVITDFSPDGARDTETVVLYSTNERDAFEGDNLAFGADCYAVVPGSEAKDFVIKHVEFSSE